MFQQQIEFLQEIYQNIDNQIIQSQKKNFEKLPENIVQKIKIIIQQVTTQKTVFDENFQFQVQQIFKSFGQNFQILKNQIKLQNDLFPKFISYLMSNQQILNEIDLFFFVSNNNLKKIQKTVIIQQSILTLKIYKQIDSQNGNLQKMLEKFATKFKLKEDPKKHQEDPKKQQQKAENINKIGFQPLQLQKKIKKSQQTRKFALKYQEQYKICFHRLIDNQEGNNIGVYLPGFYNISLQNFENPQQLYLILNPNSKNYECRFCGKQFSKYNYKAEFYEQIQQKQIFFQNEYVYQQILKYTKLFQLYDQYKNELIANSFFIEKIEFYIFEYQKQNQDIISITINQVQNKDTQNEVIYTNLIAVIIFILLQQELNYIFIFQLENFILRFTEEEMKISKKLQQVLQKLKKYQFISKSDQNLDFFFLSSFLLIANKYNVYQQVKKTIIEECDFFAYLIQQLLNIQEKKNTLNLIPHTYLTPQEKKKNGKNDEIQLKKIQDLQFFVKKKMFSPGILRFPRIKLNLYDLNHPQFTFVLKKVKALGKFKQMKFADKFLDDVKQSVNLVQFPIYCQVQAIRKSAVISFWYNNKPQKINIGGVLFNIGTADEIIKNAFLPIQMYTRQKNLLNIPCFIDKQNINFNQNQDKNTQTFRIQSLLIQRLSYISKIALLTQNTEIIHFSDLIYNQFLQDQDKFTEYYFISTNILNYMINSLGDNQKEKNYLFQQILYFDCNIKFSQFEIYLFQYSAIENENGDLENSQNKQNSALGQINEEEENDFASVRKDFED